MKRKRIILAGGLLLVLAFNPIVKAEEENITDFIEETASLEENDTELEIIEPMINYVESEIIVEPETEPISEFTEDLIILSAIEENPTYGLSEFYPKLEHMGQYSLISLTDMNIRCHVRGSIYCGGTLIGSQYIDDGTLNSDRKPHSDSYIYNNQSTIAFHGRSDSQSQYAYYELTKDAVKKNANYWTSVFNTLMGLPENDRFIYVKPEANGYADLKLWDYHRDGSDDAYNHIEKIYYTDAEFVDIGGLAGNVIAPYANIRIVSCNYSGCIIGKSITNDGENHVNDWKPEIIVTPSTEEEETTEAQTTEAQTTEAQTTEAQTTEAQTTEAQTTEAQTTEAQTTEAQTTEARRSEQQPVVQNVSEPIIVPETSNATYTYTTGPVQTADRTDIRLWVSLLGFSVGIILGKIFIRR